MLFLQMFDTNSSTYTYLLAQGVGRKAIIIDPVYSNIDTYYSTLQRLNLKLAIAIDTHTHADHITGLGELRDLTHCVTALGEQNKVESVGMHIKDGDVITCDGVELHAMYTPGHTDDSYSFLCENRLFTGDTLLIGGTGRTDFQNGNSYDSFNSLHKKLLTHPDDTLVYPAHDYHENTVTTVGYEKAHNPRLQAKTREEYKSIMDGLNLARPKMMDVAVPANLALGQDISKYVADKEEVAADKFAEELAKKKICAIDLREEYECARDGQIPGTVNIPYTSMDAELEEGGRLRSILDDCKGDLRSIVLFCAFGERSALALHKLHQSGVKDVRHLQGGFAAWIKQGGEPIK